MKKTKILPLSLTILSVMCFSQSAQVFASEICKAKTTQTTMEFKEAKKIAQNGNCMSLGKLKEKHWCNEITGTWWIMLETKLKGCNPACVIDLETKKSEINYMCTGLLPEKKRPKAG